MATGGGARAWQFPKRNDAYGEARLSLADGAPGDEDAPFPIRRQTEADLEAGPWGLLGWEDPLAVIASFVTGPGPNTLPILICSRIRLGLRPDINALATIIILAVATGVAIAAYLMVRLLDHLKVERAHLAGLSKISWL